MIFEDFEEKLKNWTFSHHENFRKFRGKPFNILRKRIIFNNTYNPGKSIN